METIFYSWQSDTEKSYNRNFIESCIKKALKERGKSEEYSLDLALDRDTKNTLGSPDITSVIFEKIKSAALFIADVTIINADQDDQRKICNPNVLIELGYAAGILGWDNVILVCNTEYGIVESLPFDLRSRRIATYTLSSQEDKMKAKEQLTGLFKDVLKEMDPIVLGEQRLIERAYAHEPDSAVRLVKTYPDLWEFKLMIILIRDRLRLPQKRFGEVQRQVVFHKKRELEAEDFFAWIGDIYTDLLAIVAVMTNLVNNECLVAVGAQGVKGDPILIKDVADKIYEISMELFEIEKRINNVNTITAFQEIVNLMQGWSEEIFKSFEELVEGLELFVESNGQQNRIAVTINAPSTMETVSEKIEWCKGNLHKVL